MNDLDQNLRQMLVDDSSITDIHLIDGGPIWIRSRGALKRSSHKLVIGELAAWLSSIHFQKTDPHQSLMSHGGDEDFGVSIGQSRVRCHAYIASGMLRVEIRRFSDKAIQFSELGLPTNALALADKTRGLFLVTGGTGSGKSTTLAAIIHHMNETREAHIITIEDPIEYLYRPQNCLITQRSVGRDAKDFARALRASLREDPDVILIGELRDRETVEIALAAAQTGHMVLATLHTNSGPQTIERIASFFSESDRKNAAHTLASVLTGIVSQVLLHDQEGEVVLAAEVLIPTASIRQGIRQGTVMPIQQEMETGSSDGQLTLNRSLAALVQAGRISREIALFHSSDPERLRKIL